MVYLKNEEHYKSIKATLCKRFERMSEEQLALRLGSLLIRRYNINHELAQAWIHDRVCLQAYLGMYAELLDYEISLIRESVKRGRQGGEESQDK